MCILLLLAVLFTQPSFAHVKEEQFRQKSVNLIDYQLNKKNKAHLSRFHYYQNDINKNYVLDDNNNIKNIKLTKNFRKNKKEKIKTINQKKQIDYSKNNITVVIDPGHGGEDPGAISINGYKEKDISLSISKRIKFILEKNMLGVRVLLTRKKDETLSLPARTDFANQMKASVFVSLHVNSSPNQDSHGIETYYLNISHDKYALRLAARENSMTEEETSNLEFILADLSMKSSVYDSFYFGRLMQYSLFGNLIKQWDNIRNLGVKNAMFYVLMGAKMPAILIEISFISNELEEKRLKTNDYQFSAAEGVAIGIQRFIEERIIND